MGVDTVSLSIVTTQLISFQKGDKIIVDGDEYFIRTTVNRNRLSEDYYVYEPVFFGVMYDLMKTLYRNTDANGMSDSSVFDLTYTLKEFVRVIINNLNRDYLGVWSFDELGCPDTEAMTVPFDKQNCLQVLQTLCGKDYFDIDFRITQGSGHRTIHIGHFGDVITPPGGATHFEWGKGNGLYQLREEKIDDKAIKTRLWVEGGSQNLSSSYRNYAGKLQLPYPQRLNKNPHTLKDGTVIAANSQTIGLASDGCRYFEDAELAAALGSDEDAIEYENIYPKRTGTVTSLWYDLVDGDLVLDINSFIDNTMDFDLSELDAGGNTKYLIDGVTAKITFVSGRLAGQQFELSASEGYTHSTKRFKLIPYTDERGLTIPTADNEAFRIAVGDKYKITDIILPQSYVDDAEEELWYEGKQYFDTIKQARCKYTMTLDRMYFLEETPSDQTMCVFRVGDYAPVKDTRFNLEKNIRIIKVQRNLLLDQDYTVTLSDTHTIDIITQTVVDVAQHEVIIRTNHLKDLIKARRSWRTTEELLSMVFDVEGHYYSEKIKPLSIETSMLEVGAKSQQFVLTGVVFAANYNSNPNRFYASSGVLSHLTIDDTNIRSWNMGTAEFTLQDTGGYYLYAKCPKSGANGVWYLTQDQIIAEPDSDPSHWYFQVGVVGTLHSDDLWRDFATTYGFTRINGRAITTGRIESSGGGYTYFDLDEGEIGGNLKILSGSSGLNNFAEWSDLSNTIDDLEQATGDAQDAIDDLSEYVDGAFADGIVTEAEAVAIQKYINTVNNTKEAVLATYNKLYANTYLEGTPKTNLLNAKVTLMGAIDDLITAINNAIADGKATSAEKTAVNNKFTAFNTALSTFNTRVEEANKAIQDKLKSYSDTVASELSVEKDKISANTTRISTVENTISTAGWITTEDGNLLYAAKSLENGNNIISYINQNATTVTIDAARINLEGQVTFNMFSSGLQGTINGKQDSSGLGTLAYLNSVAKSNLVSTLQNTIDAKLETSDMGSLAFLNSIGYSNLASTLQTTINGKANSNDLGTLAGKSSVSWSELASNLQTIINGKLTSNDVGSCAYLDAIDAGNLTNTLAATINAKLVAGDMGDLAWKSKVAKTDLATALSNLIDGKATASDLGSLAYYSKVGKALLDTTVISGGYILTSLIDVDSLYVKHLQASLGYVTVKNDYSGLVFNYNNGSTNRDFVCVDSSGFKVRSQTGSDSYSTFSNTSLELNGGTGTARLQNGSNGGYLLVQGNASTKKIEINTISSLYILLKGLPTSSNNLVTGQVYQDGAYLKVKT